jgi:hypothetical protein
MSYEQALEKRIEELESMVLWHIRDKEELLERVSEEWRFLCDRAALVNDLEQSKRTISTARERLGHILVKFAE